MDHPLCPRPTHRWLPPVIWQLAAEGLIWDPETLTPASKHMHMGQRQWSLLRGKVWSDRKLAKPFFPERANSFCTSCSSSVRQWPTSSTLQGGNRVLRRQQQLAHKSISSLLSIWESWCLASRIKRSNQMGHMHHDCCPRGALLSWQQLASFLLL